MRVRRYTGVTILSATFLAGAWAQTATLVGTVLDSSGAAVAGARVEVKNTATNETHHADSDAKGECIVADLAPGPYQIRVTKEGFQSLLQDDLVLELEQEARIEFRLSLGAVAQTIEVKASAPLLNTENAVKGEVMLSREIVEMPLNGRDFTDLAALTPGVMPKQQGGAGSAFAINGARADNTNFVIDGFNDQNPRGAAAQARPNLDALEEFKMQTTGYSAETGRLAGGVLTMVLKSGGNQFHGVLFEFLRNEFADARGFFDDAKSRLRRNQFGGTLSGPVLIPRIYNGRNRTFFLFSWESERQQKGEVKLGIVPTAEQRAGNFSALGPIKDPVAKNNFAGGRIPLSRLSPVALQAQAFFPLPNRPDQANNYKAYAIAPDDWDADVIKIDHHLSTSDSLSYRWLKRYNRSAAPYNNSDLGFFGRTVRNHQTLTGATHTHIFSPALINEARLGFSRTDEGALATTQGIDYNAQFGLPSPLDPRLIGFPLFVITNYEKLGNGSNLPVHFTVNNFEVEDSITIVKAMHLVKVGFDVLRTQFFQPYFNNNRGTFNFLGRWTGQPYADFLLGLPESTSHQTGTTTNYMLSSNISAFVQDDWKIASRLTLNLGLRYEFPKPMYDKYDRYTNFVPELGKLVLASDATLAGAAIGFSDPSRVTTAKAAGLPRSLAFTNYKNFAPRFGMAWRPFGGANTVVRGGYGIFYGGGILNDMRNNLANVFPFAISQTFNRQTNNVGYLTLANPFPAPPNLTGNVVNANGLEIHAKTPYLQSWNLTIERTVGLASAIEIGYVGSKGTHLGRYYNINQPYRSAQTAPNFPVPYASFGTINYYGFNANSTYNSGSVSLRRRFASGFFYRLNYTYSKSIDDTSQLNGAGNGGYSGVQNVRNLHGDRGRSDWDLGHSITNAFSWTAPWTKHILLRGWQLAGTTMVRSGQPFTPQVNNVNLNLGEANRPDRLAKGTVPNPNPDKWYDAGSFPPVPAGSFRFGNSGRNILDGPGMIQVNSSLYKNFQSGEGRGVQFRWEVFNVLNHSNLHLPAVNVNAPNAATIISAGDPRLMQFGVRCWF